MNGFADDWRRGAVQSTQYHSTPQICDCASLCEVWRATLPTGSNRRNYVILCQLGASQIQGWNKHSISVCSDLTILLIWAIFGLMSPMPAPLDSTVVGSSIYCRCNLEETTELCMSLLISLTCYRYRQIPSNFSFRIARILLLPKSVRQWQVKWIWFFAAMNWWTHVVAESKLDDKPVLVGWNDGYTLMLWLERVSTNRLAITKWMHIMIGLSTRCKA